MFLTNILRQFDYLSFPLKIYNFSSPQPVQMTCELLVTYIASPLPPSSLLSSCCNLFQQICWTKWNQTWQRCWCVKWDLDCMMQMKLIRNGEGVNKYWNVFQIKTAISASFIFIQSCTCFKHYWRITITRVRPMLGLKNNYN